MMEPVRESLQNDGDLALARRVAAGDRGAFEAIMRRYNRRLYRLARATLRSDQDAEDALQDAYIAAYRSMAQFRGDCALSTWLSRIVLNACFVRLRKEARRENVIPIVAGLADAEIESMATHHVEEPVEALARTEMRRVLEHQVGALPLLYRTVFVMRSVEELTVEETAQCLGVPEATVRSRHFRAKSMLREALARELDVATGDLFTFGGEHCDRIVAAVLERLDDN